jgi:hypothetical protein
MMYGIPYCCRRVLIGCFEAYRERSSAADGCCQTYVVDWCFVESRGTAENIGYGGMLE